MVDSSYFGGFIHYNGSKENFLKWYINLTDQTKKDKINRSIVFIHENPLPFEENVDGAYDGYIFAYGQFYTAKETVGLDASAFKDIVTSAGNVKAELVDSSSKLKFTFEPRYDSSTTTTYTDKVLVNEDGQIVDASNKVLYANASLGSYYIYINASSNGTEYQRTAYVKTKVGDNEQWVALNGNVKAENVYFGAGVQRNASWGVKSATEGSVITTECEGKNLKELLEYYLVSETWPGANTTTGSLSPADYTLNVNNPKNLKAYLSGTNDTALYEVGTELTLNVSINTTASLSNNTITYTGTANQHYNMSFGYEDESGTYFNNDTCTGTKPTITFNYVNNFSDENTKAKLTIVKTAGFSNFETLSREVTVGTNVEISSVKFKVDHGTNTLKLTYTNDASAIRVLNTSTFGSAIGKVYYRSNKNASDNIHTLSELALVIPKVTYTNAHTYSYSSKDASYNAIGVYAIYSNMEETTERTEGKIAEGIENKTSALKLSIKNYNNNLTLFFKAGAVPDPEKRESYLNYRYIYLPHIANLTISTIGSWDVDSKGYNNDAGTFIKSNDTSSFNNVTYDIWQYGESGASQQSMGALEIKIEIKK